MKETKKTSSLRLKPLVACLAMSMAVASTGGLLAPELANAEVTRFAGKPASARVSQAQRAEALAQVREYRQAVRGKGNLQARTDRPAATVPVTSCADDGSAGTLRAVVGSAVDGDTVDLSALTCSQITLTSGEIDVAAPNLTIQGPGAKTLSINAGGSNRAFYHHAGSDGGTLTLADVTVTNGYYFDDYLIAPGGCVYSTGSVTLNNATITNCKAVGKYSGGGAINAGDDITLTNSTVSGNQSLGNVTKYGGKYDGPQGGGQGGGLYAGGNVTISKSTISNNRAELTSGAAVFNRGGGVFAFGAITVSDSAISNNEVAGNDYGGLGGGIFANDKASALTITNSTISGNQADGGGGVLSIGPLALANSTVAFNTAQDDWGAGGIADLHEAADGTSTINSSIVAKNAGTGGFGDADFGSRGYTVEGANNLIIAASGEDLPADTLSDDPLLLPLADNGGPTLTHALGTGSPAIDAGNNVKGLAFDQRGEPYAREVGKAADIGAFESQGDDDDVIFTSGFDAQPVR